MILKQIRTGSRVKKARSKVDEIGIKRHLLLTIVRKKETEIKVFFWHCQIDLVVAHIN